VEETDARDVTVRRTPDALGRVVLVDYPDNSLDTIYSYDDASVPFAKGRLTGITRDGETIAYGYDRFGRLTGDGDLSYGYDVNGNRDLVVYPGGVEAQYSYDFADRQLSLGLMVGGTSRALASGA
jgi:YD repeat-containing protein